jgi:hypothetical protein
VPPDGLPIDETELDQPHREVQNGSAQLSRWTHWPSQHDCCAHVVPARSQRYEHHRPLARTLPWKTQSTDAGRVIRAHALEPPKISPAATAANSTLPIEVTRIPCVPSLVVNDLRRPVHTRTQ